MMKKTLLLGSATLVVVALAVFSLTLPSETQTLMATSPEVLTRSESGSGGGEEQPKDMRKDCPAYLDRYEWVTNPLTGEREKILFRDIVGILPDVPGVYCVEGDTSCTPVDPCK